MRVNHHDAYRTSHEVCWTWSSDKLRYAVSDHVDVQLDIVGSGGRVRDTFERRRARARPPGRSVLHRLADVVML